MAFSTPTEVKVNTEVLRLTTQAAWADPQFDDRIREGDTEIEACLADMGYDVVAIKAGAVPPLLNELSKLYARAAILRDLFTRGPVATSEDRHEKMFKEFHDRINRLKKREFAIVDATGAVITFTDSNQEILVNTLDVPRALGMEEPESQSIDSPAYSDADMRGDPE